MAAKLTLWMAYTKGGYIRLFPFYALDEDHARERALHHLKQWPGYILDKLEHMPGGFQQLPGAIYGEPNYPSDQGRAGRTRLA